MLDVSGIEAGKCSVCSLYHESMLKSFAFSFPFELEYISIWKINEAEFSITGLFS